MFGKQGVLVSIAPLQPARARAGITFPALLQKYLLCGIAEVLVLAASQDPCSMAICSSSALCSDISSFSISGPMPKARSTRRTSPLIRS